jgi:rSAM/selenodomain-associated transferase 1
MSRVLGVFAKWPRPGLVKTRLAAVLGPDRAAQIADAFLRDTLDRLAAVVPATRRVIAFAPDDAKAHFADLVGGRFALRPQGDGDLGARIKPFLSAELAVGADTVVIVGTDSPTLPVSLVEAAFCELERADIVLGPATDGGYYLLGCARRVPPVFDGVSWGTSYVLAETLARLPADFRVGVLPPWYDVDTPDDLKLLRGHATALRRAGIDPGIPRTEALLAEEAE